MKSNHSRWSVAALLLIFCLTAAPGAAAGPFRDRDGGLREPIVRVIKKIRQIFTIVTHDGEYPGPPKP